jgi:RimJ/RimL family protein N-acetyltransferase
MNSISQKFLHQSRICFDFCRNCLQVRIETDRLLIRSYQEEDFEDCVLLYGDKELIKYFDYGVIRTRDEVKNLISEKTCNYFNKGRPFGLFSVFLKESMTFIGQMDLLPLDGSNTVEIGFIVRKEFHGRGYCIEAVKSLIFDYLKTINSSHKDVCLPILEVVATVHPDNLPSIRVLEKAGMKFEKFQERFKAPRLWYYLSLTRKNEFDFKHVT